MGEAGGSGGEIMETTVLEQQLKIIKRDLGNMLNPFDMGIWTTSVRRGGVCPPSRRVKTQQKNGTGNTMVSLEFSVKILRNNYLLRKLEHFILASGSLALLLNLPLEAPGRVAISLRGRLQRY